MAEQQDVAASIVCGGSADDDSQIHDGGGDSLPFGLKEEATSAGSVANPTETSRPVVPTYQLEVKLKSQWTYSSVNHGDPPILWNPTIPIALRKLTI